MERIPKYNRYRFENNFYYLDSSNDSVEPLRLKNYLMMNYDPLSLPKILFYNS